MPRCGCPFTVGRKPGVTRGEKTARTAEPDAGTTSQALPVFLLHISSISRGRGAPAACSWVRFSQQAKKKKKTPQSGSERAKEAQEKCRGRAATAVRDGSSKHTTLTHNRPSRTSGACC